MYLQKDNRHRSMWHSPGMPAHASHRKQEQERKAVPDWPCISIMPSVFDGRRNEDLPGVESFWFSPIVVVARCFMKLNSPNGKITCDHRYGDKNVHAHMDLHPCKCTHTCIFTQYQGCARRKPKFTATMKWKISEKIERIYFKRSSDRVRVAREEKLVTLTIYTSVALFLLLSVYINRTLFLAIAMVLKLV